jgi:hypothetical protein
MKIYFNNDGSIKEIKERDLLISSSDGVNIIRAYTEDAAVNNARISFQRNDGFVISELVMTRVYTEENAQGVIVDVNAYELALTANLGILDCKGELQITVRFIKLTTDTDGNITDEKTQACGLITAHVYQSIEDPEDVKTPQQIQIDNLKEEAAKTPAIVEAHNIKADAHKDLFDSKADKAAIPVKTSQLENDSGFQTAPYNDEAIKGRLDVVEADVTNLKTPIDYLGVIAAVSWSAGAGAKTQAEINAYIQSQLPAITFRAGHAVVLNNTSTSAQSAETSGGVLVVISGNWLWVFNGTDWQPVLQFINDISGLINNYYTKDEADKRFDEVIPLVSVTTLPATWEDFGYRPIYAFNFLDDHIYKYNEQTSVWEDFGLPKYHTVYLYNKTIMRYTGSHLEGIGNTSLSIYESRDSFGTPTGINEHLYIETSTGTLFYYNETTQTVEPLYDARIKAIEDQLIGLEALLGGI